ncbi:MAG: hypothetical protein LWW93_16665 [Hyphomicrobiales bacterium]|nr:hypothetical protein [Hyphomicrobiales bacterium]
MQTSSLIASTAASQAPTPVHFDFTPYGISPKRPVEVRRDPSGELVVFVKLTKGNTAVTTVEEFTRLMEAGISPNWCVNDNGVCNLYVRCERPRDFGGNKLMVARLIAGPTARGFAVRYADRNSLNLRPTNLVLEKGKTRAKLKEPEIIARAA